MGGSERHEKFEQAGGIEMIKQVIVIRRDLHMRQGKAVAQGAHAAMLFLIDRLTVRPGEGPEGFSEAESEWLEGSMGKICVRVESEEELLQVIGDAREAGLTVHAVTDSGRTEFGGVPTLTCCAIGPNEADRIDAVTGHLKLL